jgi:hypothetical protein
MTKKVENLNTPPNPSLDIAGVSHSEFLSYCDLVLSYLKDGECISIPTRVLFQVAANIEQKGISFRFTNNPKEKWTTLHCLYCHCG